MMFHPQTWLITLVFALFIQKANSIQRLGTDFTQFFNKVGEYQGSQSEDVVLTKDEQYCIVSQQLQGVKIFDLKNVNPSADRVRELTPSAFKKYSFQSEGMAVTNDGQFLFVVQNREGFRVLRIDDHTQWSESAPYELKEVARFDSSEIGVKSIIVDKNDEFAFFGNGKQALLGFDIRGKNGWGQQGIITNLAPVIKFDSEFYSKDPFEGNQDFFQWILIFNDYSNIITVGGRSVKILSANNQATWYGNPSSPVALSRIARSYQTNYPTDWDTSGATLSNDGSYLFVAYKEHGIFILDLKEQSQWQVSQVNNIKITGFIPMYLTTYAVKFWTEDLLLVSSKESGITAFQIPLSKFRSTTLIEVEDGFKIIQDTQNTRIAISQDSKLIFTCSLGLKIHSFKFQLSEEEQKDITDFNTIGSFEVVGTAEDGQGKQWKVIGDSILMAANSDQWVLGYRNFDNVGNYWWDSRYKPAYPYMTGIYNNDNGWMIADVDLSSDNRFLMLANLNFGIVVINVGSLNFIANYYDQQVLQINFSGSKTQIVQFSPDVKYGAVFLDPQGIVILDFTSDNTWSTGSFGQDSLVVAQYPYTNGDDYSDMSIAFSSDGNFLFVPTQRKSALEVLDLRDQGLWIKGNPTTLKLAAHYTRGDGLLGTLTAFYGKDAKYLYVTDFYSLKVFDISQMVMSFTDYNLTLVAEAASDGIVRQAIVSSNNNFVVVADYSKGVKIIDIKDKSLWNTQQVTQLRFLVSFRTVSKYDKIQLNYVQLIKEDKYLAVGNLDQGINIINLSVDQTLYKTSSDNFFTLGKAQDLFLFPVRYNNDYRFKKHTPDFEQFNFAEFNEITTDEQGNIVRTPIDWASVDLEQGKLTAFTTNKAHLGNHTVAAKVLFRVPRFAFADMIDAGAEIGIDNSKWIHDQLNILGYIDGNGYITANYSDQPITLYIWYTNTQNLIRSILKQYIGQYVFKIEIQPNLNITQISRDEKLNLGGKILQIQTLSIRSITVSIKFDQSVHQLEFIRFSFTGIQIKHNQNGHQLTLVGSLININNALQVVKLYIPQYQKLGDVDFQGTVIVDDQLHSPLEKRFPALNQLFQVNKKPVIEEKIKLSKQFEIQNPIVKINKPLGFLIDMTAFTDEDQDVLILVIDKIYQTKVANDSQVQTQIQTLPQWLSYDNKIRRFYGTPIEFDVIYDIQMVCTDGYFNVSDTFTIDLQIEPPTQNPDEKLKLDNQIKSKLEKNETFLQVGQPFEFIIDPSTYQNIEELQFTAFMRQKHVGRMLQTNLDQAWIQLSLATQGSWLYFDQRQHKLFGSPTKNDLQAFEVQILASDGFKTTEDKLQFQVNNSPPTIQQPFKTQQIDNYAPIEEKFEFQFDQNTFSDPDGDQLQLTLSVQGMTDIPPWIRFNAIERKVQITAPDFNWVRIVIRAMDPSETYVEDVIQVRIESTLIYVIRIIALISGPLFSIIGLIKYRSNLHSILCRRKYFYPNTFVAYVGHQFQFQIPLNGPQYQQSEQLWMNYEQKTIQQQVRNLHDIMKDFCVEEKLSEKKIFQLLKTDESFKLEFTLPDESQTILGDLVVGMGYLKFLMGYDDVYQIFYREREKLKSQSQSPLDWYRCLVNIEAIKDMNKNMNPIVTERNQSMNEFVASIQQSRIELTYFRKVIFECIQAQAIGIMPYQSFRSAFGESLRREKEDISTIKALQATKKSCCPALFQESLELANIQSFPQWMKVTINFSSIFIRGIPPEQDEREITIIVEDVRNFRLKQIKIVVEKVQQISQLTLMHSVYQDVFNNAGPTVQQQNQPIISDEIYSQIPLCDEQQNDIEGNPEKNMTKIDHQKQQNTLIDCHLGSTK